MYSFIPFNLPDDLIQVVFLHGRFVNLYDMLPGIMLVMFILLTSFFMLLFYGFDFRLYVLFYGWIVLCWFIYMFVVTQAIATSFSYYMPIFYVYSMNLSHTLQFDLLALSFIVLTALLFVICVLLVWNVKYKLKELFLLLFLVKLLLVNLFCVTDLLFFYIFFEAILIPMVLLMGVWGSRERKFYAAYQFFIYTLLGSLFMLGSILWLYSHVGTTDFRILCYFNLTSSSQCVLWLAMFAAMAVKVPMMPVHLWLPEAHVEAPTVGSVLLAGVLLKLGTYAVVSFLYPLFPEASMYFTPLVVCFAAIAVMYSSLTTLVQVDMKKLVAYSSVAHMNLVVLGLFTLNFAGYIGAIMLMLSHGIMSSALFVCVGVLYDRYKTRLLVYLGGLASLMPIFAFLYFWFSLGNMAFPGTFGFIGEVLMLLGLFTKNSFLGLFVGLSVILSAGYSLVLYSHTMNGTLRFAVLKFYSDVLLRELFVLGILFVLMVFFGLQPMFAMSSFEILAPTFSEM